MTTMTAATTGQLSPSTNVQLVAPSASDRLHYLDNLRALAMLSGIFLHAGLAYDASVQKFWLATDPSSSIVVHVLIWFVHLFRMALFFLISGYFAKLLVVRKGTKGFLWNRTVRILFPFLLFYPFLLIAIVSVISFAISYVENAQGIIGLIQEAIRTKQTGEQPPPNAMHLWFLYYLMIFSLLAPLISRIKLRPLDWIVAHRWLLVLMPLALIPGAIGGGIPTAAPESFIPQCWPFVFYGLFYATGWQLYGRESIIESFRPYMWLMGGLVVALFVPYLWLMPVSVFPNLQQIGTWQLCTAAALGAYLSSMLVVLSLLLGRTYLSQRNSTLRFVADSSYWVYLIHLPIVLLIQTFLIQFSFNVWIKLTMTIVGTMAFCLLTYMIFVRYTILGRLLNGKRTFP